MTPKTLIKVIGVLLIAAGILGLVYDTFSYTESTHEAQLGPLEFQVKEKKTVTVPQWVGIAAIIVGAGLLVVPMKSG
ncbi:MAG: hypothetical protein HUU46_16520 [Candidatus Hydrogenedentes bacterium]|nr:hypothetical protein [Candidatus Hydrogenedentota bacterium]